MFLYACKYRKDDDRKIIEHLKEKCLEAIRNHLKYLSELPDDKLLEILDKEEYDFEDDESN